MAQSGESIIESIAAIECLAGGPVLAGFERERLLARIAAAGIGPGALDAHAVYIAAFSETPDADTRERLQALLGVDAGAPVFGQAIVVPRLGTLSAWSTKAQDIAHNSGLKTLLRLERAVSYRFEHAPDVAALIRAGVLHDPMTESLLDDPAYLDTLLAERRGQIPSWISSPAIGMSAWNGCPDLITP